ncbi:androgen-dependent TFPI-regulating protein-like [Lycorma delicatula]|uniref:androgen-dependent TFPI-regulating protein-like n=1 Tax=Lycorma delicatula TaxID=130591 RepID=UPI003F51453A
MTILIKLCHWFIMLFYLVLIYCGLKSIFFPSLAVEMLSEKEVVFIMKMAKNNLWLYFSIWSVVLQVAYFLLVSILELVDSVYSMTQMASLKKQVEIIRKYFFISLVFPITLCADVTFWTVYAYDKERLYPSAVDKIIDPWLNHGIHTIPSVLVFIHVFIADFSGINTKLCLKLLLSFDIIYSACFVWSGLVNENWVYLIFETMSVEKITLCVLICNLSTGFYFAVARLLSSYKKRIKEHGKRTIKKIK